MSLGALTTPFAPAPSCLDPSNIWQIRMMGPFSTSIWYEQFGPPLTSDCMPPNYNPESTAYYSPGFCPSGYSKASSGSTILLGGETETTHVCCPTAFSFAAQSTGESDETLPFLDTLLCESIYGTATWTLTSQNVGEKPFLTVATVTTNGALNAYGIVVKFRSEDLVTKTSSTTTGTPESSTSPADRSSTMSSGPTPSAVSSGSGLSTGASVGVGVSVGVVGLGLVIGLVYLILQRRKRRISNQEEIGEVHKYRLQDLPEWTGPNPHGMDHTPQGAPSPVENVSELSGSNKESATSTRAPFELGSS